MSLPPRGGAPVVCTYKAGGLAAADGAVLPLVFADGADAPAPAAPAAYSLAAAAREEAAACADVGNSLRLLQGGRAAPWQPAFIGRPLGSGACVGETQRFELAFGGAADGTPADVPCGDYEFAASLTAVPRGGGEAVAADAGFAVKITGCKR